MKNATLFSAIAAASLGLAASFALAQSTDTVTSLRGAQPDQDIGLAPIYHQEEGRQDRNYRQQPPIIPHTIDKYQIDVKANECLACHDWKNAAERAAPTLSMTHYVSRDGVQTDDVAPRRWFCNQCHVPQVNAPELVQNTFKGSDN